MKLSIKMFIVSGLLVALTLIYGASRDFFGYASRLAYEHGYMNLLVMQFTNDTFSVVLIGIAIVCGIIGLVKMGDGNEK